jgi:hypothetical protein
MESAHREDDGLGVSAVLWMHQIVCGFHGHDNLPQYERNRIFLKCVSCGHETPGWELTEAPPTVVFHGDARRHALGRPQLIDRVA